MKKIQSVFYDSFLAYINQVKANHLPAKNSSRPAQKSSKEVTKTRRLSGCNLTTIHGQSYIVKLTANNPWAKE